MKDSHKTGDGFRQQWVPVLAAVLASSGMYVFSTGLHPTGWLTWLAPLPILLVAFRLSWRAAFAAAFLACFIGQLNMLGYLLRLVPLGPLLVFLAVPALVFALGVLFARGTVRRTESWLAVLAFPVAWTAYEFLLALASPNGTFGSVAYSQVELLPVIQVASLTGIAGITFLLTLVPSALAVAWRLRRRRAAAGKALAAGLVPLVLVLSFGWFRLAGSAGGPSIRVGLAATDRTVGRFCTEDRAEAIPVVEDYARRVGDLAARGAGVVVLPEKFVGVAPAYAAEVYKLLSATARMNRVAVIAGLNWVGISPRRNVAVVFSPDGRYVEYDKVHFVPGLEMGYCSGIRPLILPLAGIPAGVAVCKDMDFPAWTRRYATAGARILFVPAWDFGEDGWLHARMAVLRGVEGGFAVGRTAQEGLLTVSDAYGRILAEKRSGDGPEALLVDPVPAGPGDTLYSEWGDWFGWLNLAALAVGLHPFLRRGFAKLRSAAARA